MSFIKSLIQVETSWLELIYIPRGRGWGVVNQESFVREGSAPLSNPLPLKSYAIFDRKSICFEYLVPLKCYPFHTPT